MAPKGRRPMRAEGDRTRQVFWECDIIPVPLSPDGTGRSKADVRGTWPMRARRGRRAQAHRPSACWSSTEGVHREEHREGSFPSHVSGRSAASRRSAAQPRLRDARLTVRFQRRQGAADSDANEAATMKTADETRECGHRRRGRGRRGLVGRRRGRARGQERHRRREGRQRRRGQRSVGGRPVHGGLEAAAGSRRRLHRGRGVHPHHGVRALVHERGGRQGGGRDLRRDG